MHVYSLIHAVGTGAFGYATYYEFFVLHAPRGLRRTPDFMTLARGPGKWKYLTVWNLVMQFAYHSYSLVNDITGSNAVDRKRQSVLQKIRDLTFASVIFPVGSFVCVSFWSIYSIDRELVFPAILDTFYPSWLNHAVHSLPIILLAAEIYFTPRTYPNKTVAVVGNLSFSVTYLTWVSYVAQKYGVWAYKILEVLGMIPRSFFLGSCAAAILGFFYVGEKVHDWKWGSDIRALEEASPKKAGTIDSKKSH